MGGLKFFRLVELPAPRQEDYFGSVFRFVCMWVGPHSALKLKTILLAKGAPKSIQAVDRLKTSARQIILKEIGAPN